VETITAEEFKKRVAKRTAKNVKSSGANQLTKNVLTFLRCNGWEAWRNNVMGVFDSNKAAKAIVAQKPNTHKTAQGILKKCYRKSHERKGVSDVIGFNKKTGQFIAVEVKFGKDNLSIEQDFFLKAVKRSGGIAIVAKTYDQFVTDFYKATDNEKRQVQTKSRTKKE